MKISIIIPSSNNLENGLFPLLHSIEKYTDLTDIEIIIIANGYNIKLKDRFIFSIPIELIWFDNAIGFSKAINEGIKASKGKYIILLNDDIILLEQHKNQWINMLLEPFLKDNITGITGPVKRYSNIINKDFILFFCACIKKDIIDKIGLLDENFRIGSQEDIDYSARIENEGYKLVQVPGEISSDNKQIIGGFPIYHSGGKTVNKISNWKEIFEANEEKLKHKYNTNIKRLNIGCGDLIFDKWINIDMYSNKAQLKCNALYLPFKNNSIDEIYSSHLIEHFNFLEAFEVLKEWKRVLKNNGIITIESPDLLESCKKFVEGNEQDRINLYSHFFSEPWIKGQYHKFLYTKIQLKWTLEQVGFRNINIQPALRYIEKENICLKMTAIK